MNDLSASTRRFAAPVFDGVTAREFMRMIEEDIFDGANVELIAGVILKVAPSHIDHASLNAGVVVSLAKALRTSPAKLAVDLAIETDDHTIFGIDIAVVNETAPSSGPISGNHVELAVEVASTTLAKDLGHKAVEYARVGVATYWVVDVKGKVVHVMTGPQPDGYAHRAVVRFGEQLSVPGTADTIIVG